MDVTSMMFGGIGLMIALCSVIVYVMLVRGKKEPRQLAGVVILFVAGGLLSSLGDILLGFGVITDKAAVGEARSLGMVLFVVGMCWIVRITRASHTERLRQ